MPQNASKNYYYPDGTRGIPDQTIESEAYNTFLDDLVSNDLNWPRPIHRGGTEANNANSALVNLSGEKATQLVSNFDAHVWLPGSFYCTNATGQGAPVDGHAFAGVCYINEPLTDPPTNLNVVVEARDQTEPIATARLWLREMRAGFWSAWIEQVGGAVEVVNLLDVRYVQTTGDTITGSFVVNDLVMVGTSLDVGTTITAGGQISTAGDIYASGTVTGTNLVAAGGTLNVGSNGIIGGRLDVTGITVSAGGFSTPNDIYASGTIICTSFGPSNIIQFTGGPANRWQADGTLVISYGGFQPGGGAWTDSSDARIKTVQGDYTHGLAEIKQLMPRRYIYNGNDAVVSQEMIKEASQKSQPIISNHAEVAEEGKEFIGLVAQECETVMPEMVTLAAGTIDGQPVSDIRILNTTALTFALVNAVKELAARVEQLEAAG